MTRNISNKTESFYDFPFWGWDRQSANVTSRTKTILLLLQNLL